MFKRWGFSETHNQYTGIGDIADKLPAGMYEFSTSMRGEPVATRKDLKDDSLHEFDFGPMKPIIEEIGGFWNSAGHYKKLGVTHKRGILLYGPAGCGKTAILQAAIKDVIVRGGVAVNARSIEPFKEAIPLFRQIEDGRPVLAVIEDLDQACEYNEEEFLEVMDGATSIGHGVLFLATTNHLEKIPVRISHRPSRIDTLIEVPFPVEQQRLEYLRFIASGELKIPDDVLRKIAKQTKDFSLAALKEFVISTVVYKRDAAGTIARLKALLEVENVKKE